MILYHYCSLETMQMIIENKELWLSNVLKSNDKKEFHDMDEIFPLVFEKLEQESEEIEQALELAKNVAQYSQNIVKDRKENSIIPYVCCFSTEADDLEQWVKYADNGKGVCIAFNTEKMDGFKKINIKVDKAYENIDGYFLGQVVYEDEQKKGILADKISKRLLELIKQNKKTYDESDFYIIHSELLVASALFKSHYFKKESEWRVVYLAPDTETDERRKFLFNSKGIKGHYKLPIVPSEVIAEIVLGPNCSLDNNDRELKIFFQQNGFSEDFLSSIKKSQIPYC